MPINDGSNAPTCQICANIAAPCACTWLTTLRQPVHNMAQATVDMLTALIAKPESSPEKRVFSAQFVEGGTSRLGPA